MVKISKDSNLVNDLKEYDEYSFASVLKDISIVSLSLIYASQTLQAYYKDFNTLNMNLEKLSAENVVDIEKVVNTINQIELHKKMIVEQQKVLASTAIELVKSLLPDSIVSQFIVSIPRLHGNIVQLYYKYNDRNPSVFDLVIFSSIIADFSLLGDSIYDTVNDALSKAPLSATPHIRLLHVVGSILEPLADFFTNIANALTTTDKINNSGFPIYEIVLNNTTKDDIISLFKILKDVSVDTVLDSFEKGLTNILNALRETKKYIFKSGDVEGFYKQGTNDNDVIYGIKYKDFIQGLLGDDELHGYAGDDTLSGGLGNDTLNGGEGNDTLIDESGNETYDFIGDFGHDTIYDQDGQGVIKINYQSLSAGKKLQDDIWQSSHPDYMIRVAKIQENVEGYYSLHITSKSYGFLLYDIFEIEISKGLKI